ncbi:cytochrome c oxidase assembly factor Coa1 family protein [uncultured Maribacter sp.]|uniref:cytochrome c oxidase assembly factor Coa1 family protein n=1 Tax=uncultured Maribacter sp. TaxID=431308 RepID=UPI0030EF070E|tara:strand:+ start:64374 stop:64823 length:450 start_codon:yes stop_codon:yes gene_type:complete
MSNELINEKGWFKRNWKWIILVFLLFWSFIFFITSSGLGGLLGDYGKAYADSTFYTVPLQKVQSNSRVREILGEIEPMGKMSILNGAIDYSEDNKSVKSTIKIFGENGKAMLDISAEWINGFWVYSKINVRIKNPPEIREVIPILKSID